MKKHAAAIGAIAASCALLAAAAILARSLLASPTLAWLSAAEPPWVGRGDLLELRVELEAPEEGSFLTADAHGEGPAHEALGYIAGSMPQRVRSQRRDYVFFISIPEGLGAGYIEPIVYLSRDGSWNGMVKTARLPLVTLRQAASGEAAPALSAVKALPISGRDVAPRRESLPLRVLAALAFAACAAIGLQGERRRGLPFAAACIAACAWELAMPEGAASSLLRSVAGGEGWYYSRRGPQLAVTLLLIAGGCAAAVSAVLGQARRGRVAAALARLGLCGYASLAALRVVSEHDVDSLLSRNIFGLGLQLGQAARLAFAALCLAAAAYAASRRRAVRQARAGRVNVRGRGSA
jgi:hypothetical protein